MKKSVLFILSASLFLLSACSSATEIDKLMIVSGISIDSDENENGQFRVNTQIVNLQNASQNDLSPIILETRAKTVAGAISSLTQLEGQKLYFSHTQTIMISSQLLSEGAAAHFIELINLAPRFRSSIRLAATEGDASDVLKTEPNTDPISAFSLKDSLHESHLMLNAPDMPFYKFLNDVLETGIDGILPMVKVVGEEDNKLPFVCGTALFKDTVMVGNLTPEQSKYLLIARGKVSDAIYEVDNYAFQISSGNSRLSIEDGKIILKVKMELSLLEGENLGNKELEKIIENDITRGVNEVFALCKSLSCDPVGIGRYIKRRNINLWNDIYPENWEQIYSKIDLIPEVKASIVPSSKLSGKE